MKGTKSSVLGVVMASQRFDRGKGKEYELARCYVEMLYIVRLHISQINAMHLDAEHASVSNAKTRK